MAKKQFYAVNDIQNEKGETIVKKGDVAASIESDLEFDKVLVGLQTGAITPTKPAAEPRPKPAATEAALDAGAKK